MAKLLKEKRTYEDSLQFYTERYNIYTRKMYTLMINYHGRNAKETADTAVVAKEKFSTFEVKIKNVNYSIDSLSKIK